MVSGPLSDNSGQVKFVSATRASSEAEKAFLQEGTKSGRYSRLQFDGLDTRFAVRTMSSTEAKALSIFSQSHKFVEVNVNDGATTQKVAVNVNSLCKRLLVNELTVKTLAAEGGGKLEAFIQDRVAFLKANKQLLDSDKSKEGLRFDHYTARQMISHFQETTKAFAADKELQMKEFYTQVGGHKFTAVRAGDNIDLVYSKGNELLGKGGFGTVSKVYNYSQGTFQALKTAHKAHESTKAEFDTLHNIHAGGEKVGIQARPHTLVYKEGEQAAYLGKLYDGDCQRWVNKQPPPTPYERVKVANSLMTGLANVNKMDYWHSDIKPANCLMNSDGTAVIGDWGTAVKLDKEKEPTKQDFDIIGTKEYFDKEMIDTLLDNKKYGLAALDKLEKVQKLEAELAAAKAEMTEAENAPDASANQDKIGELRQLRQKIAENQKKMDAEKDLPKKGKYYDIIDDLQQEITALEQSGHVDPKAAHQQKIKELEGKIADELRQVSIDPARKDRLEAYKEKMHGEAKFFRNENYELARYLDFYAMRKTLLEIATISDDQLKAMPAADRKVYNEVLFNIESMQVQTFKMFKQNPKLVELYQQDLQRAAEQLSAMKAKA